MKKNPLEQLKNNFAGNIITPTDAIYASLKDVLFKTGNPAIILQPKTTSDVVFALAYARGTNTKVSVRGGGHSGAGFGTNANGLVIDLHYLNDITIDDPRHGIVSIGGGATWGNVADTLGEHGLAISSGDTRSVGVGGLTLIGGIGWMVRKYGLAIDSLIGAEIITYDGATLYARHDQNEDLFWAIRGGGGNFGVVTRFDFAAKPVRNVYAGFIRYPFEKRLEILTKWRDVMRSAPHELTSTAYIMPASEGRPAQLMIGCCHMGNNEAAMIADLQPLLTLDTPIDRDIRHRPYASLLEEPHLPKTRVISNNAFVKELSDELLSTVAEQTSRMFQIRILGGALAQIDHNTTAFGFRDSEAIIISPTFVGNDLDYDDIAEQQAPWQKIAPFSQGAYSGFLTDEATPVNSIYDKEHLEKLARIKAQYDPENIFSSNYNIQPSIASPIPRAA